MASFLPSAPSISASIAASAAVKAKSASNLPHYANSTPSTVSFRLPPTPHLRFSSKSPQPVRNSPTLVTAQLNEVSVDGSSNSASSPAKSEDAKLTDKPPAPTLATEESVSQFMAQVSSLVKLVDSRDIVELQLKQHDCELVIRKKEALPQPVAAAPVVMMPPPSPSPQPAAAPPAAPSPSSSAPPQPASAPAAAKSQKSSLPPFKCPMAGTFYRSPAPGEPPFVKVGDKVQKGQVICIVEAMKLMNEIEADQSGTIVEVIAEDGKPVSVDTPLFVIEP